MEKVFSRDFIATYRMFGELPDSFPYAGWILFVFHPSLKLCIGHGGTQFSRYHKGCQLPLISPPDCNCQEGISAGFSARMKSETKNKLEGVKLIVEIIGIPLGIVGGVIGAFMLVAQYKEMVRATNATLDAVKVSK